MTKLVQRRRRERRALLGGAVGAGAALLAGCDAASHSDGVKAVLGQAERWSAAAARIVAPPPRLAQEFSPADVAPVFRANGTLDPQDADYAALRAGAFAGWRLDVRGLVERPLSLSLADLRVLPARTQITRHDCVEGWSCIGRWTGVPLAALLDRVGLKPAARFVVFRCFDSMDDPQPGVDSRYYESLDLDEARHAQTILAYDLNGAPLPVANGAPLRLRVERQLGYKHAKYLQAIELVDSLAPIRGGRGGYWEDEGYDWYAGI